MKNFYIAFFSIILLFSFVSPVNAETIYEGKCGENATFTLDNKYNLIINGEGIMDDYENGFDTSSVWKPYRKNIKSIIINNGITSIGKFAFCNSSILNNIFIPDSVTTIGSRSFLSCVSLTNIKLPKNLSIISDRLFAHCSCLNSINFYSSVKCVESEAFNNCTSLQTVYFYGTPEEWNAIDINPEGNEALLNAEVVFISEVLPTSISISTKPTYIIGEDTALDIAVNLNNNDGTTTTLSPDEYTLETNFNPNTEGEYNIKVSYGDFTDEVTVKVEPLKMTSISITTQPEKTEFLEGTDIDLTGMILTGTYNNEKTEEITDYTIEQYSNTVGSRTIRISYGELSTELTVKFVRKSIISIQIASLPAKLLYSNDEATLDTTGLTVNAIYNNGDIQPITNYTISGFYGTKSGKQTITVSCEGFSDTFEVEVKRYDFKIDSNISKQYDFDTKTLTVGTHIVSRTDAKAVKVLVAVYDSNGALMGVKAENVFFDTNEAKDLSVGVENVEYPFDAVKVFVWDFDLDKMLPLAVGV